MTTPQKQNQTAADLYQGYDQFYNQSQSPTAPNLRKFQRIYNKQFGPLIQGDKNRTVLDIGCANGLLCAYLVSQGYQNVIGIDLNENLINQARQHVPGEFIHGDASTFFATNRKIDIVFMLNVLEHIDRPNLVPFMTQLHDSLNDQGFVVIRTPNMNNILSAAHLADDITHCTGLTEQSIAQLAQIAGFSKTEMINQFKIQNLKGKLKSILAYPIHKFLFWLRGGSKPKVFYRNLYVKLTK